MWQYESLQQPYGTGADYHIRLVHLDLTLHKVAASLRVGNQLLPLDRRAAALLLDIDEGDLPQLLVLEIPIGLVINVCPRNML